MAQHLVQTQAEVQTQQLSLLQLAISKMVELSVTELESRVQNEMLDNAALEVKDDDTPDGERTDDFGYEDNGGDSGEADAMGDYFSEDDMPDYLRQRADEQQNRNEPILASGASFYEELLRQAGEHDLNEHESEIMEYLIGSLDSDGFLRKDARTLADELAVYHNVHTSAKEVERLTGVLQRFEPRGVGARSLQECLALQLTDPDRQSAYTRTALTVVERYFKDFAARRWDVIRQRLKLDEETMAHVRHVLTHLDPMPGRALSETAAAEAPAVTPDFLVSVTDEGDISVELNRGNVPELQISRAFRDSIRQYGNSRTKLSREQKDAYVYARQKVDSARNFINLIERRRETLTAVMRAITVKQRDFFLNEDDDAALRPLTLKEVAEMAEMNLSTVSRVTGSKYVQTPYGIYPLKHFFSSQLTTQEGGEVSAKRVKTIVKELIGHEDKTHPLADDRLTELLKQQGYNVARRTVAKYRDALGIPPARLRRERM